MTYYLVKLHPNVDKFLRKLGGELETRIRNKLKLLHEDPFVHLEHFNGNFYKFRIGDYRALIDVNISCRIVFVRLLDDRRRIYRDM